LNPIDLINKAKYILIATHENPDTDTLCCAIAIGSMLETQNTKYKIFNKATKINNKYKIFDNYNKITNVLPNFYDLTIFVDCASLSRVGVKLNMKTNIINIDHHESNDNFGLVNIVNSNAVSCGLVVYKFFIDNNININKNMAGALYLSIYDDSKAFSKYSCDDNIYDVINSLTKLGAKPNELSLNFLQNNKLSKYRLYAKILNSLKLHNEGKIASIHIKQKWLNQTQADIGCCDDIPYEILKINIVFVVLFIKELTNGDTKVSIRAKAGIDITTIGKFFGGGGHKSSVSIKFKDSSIKSIKKLVLNKFEELHIVYKQI